MENGAMNTEWPTEEKQQKTERVLDGIELLKSWRLWAFIMCIVFLVSIPLSETPPSPGLSYGKFRSRFKRQVEQQEQDNEWSYKSDYEEVRKAKMELNKNVVFKIASVTRNSFQNITKNPDGSKQGTGFSFEIFNAMAQYFNFSYEIVEPSDNSFGSLRQEDGQDIWNGMIGMIVRKEVVMGVATFTETHERAAVVDFSQSLYVDEYGILIKKPDAMDNTGALFQPFSNGVWALIVLSCCTMGPSLYVLVRIQHKLFKRTAAYKEVQEYSLFDCIWFVFAGLVKQGIDVKPTLDSTRIFFATWWLFAMLITAFYTANLTAFLTLPVYHGDESLIEMLEEDHTFLFKNNSALDEEIYREPLDDFEIMKEVMADGRGLRVNSEDEALELVLEHDYIYIQESMSIQNLVAKYYKQHEHCDVLAADYRFHPKPYAFVYEKGFKYKKAFNSYIETLKRTGLIKKWIRQYLLEKAPCSKEVLAESQAAEISGNQSLTIGDCFSVFTSYIIGIIAGLALVILEKLYARQNEVKQQQPKITVTTGNIHGYTPYIRANRPLKIKTIYTGT